MKTYLSLALIALTALLSCQKQEGGESKKIALAATPTSLEFDYTKSTKTLTITSSYDPQSIKAKDSWCTVKPGTFANNSLQVDVTVEQNDNTVERSTSITVIGDKESVIIPVKQGIKQVALEVSKTSFSSTCSGIYDGSFKITSSSQPEVTSGESWCVVKAGEIDKNHETEVVVYVAGNRTEKSRTAEITVKCGSESKSIKVSQDAFGVKTAEASAITPEIVFNKMQMGWGMGNHMDAYKNDVASETVWGNEKCTQSTMDAVKKAGFNTVRIPVTWIGHIGEGPVYKIDEKWMDRVVEIAGYAKNAGLVAIVNTHHDENNNESVAHWQDIKSAYNNSTKNETIKDEIFCVWSQIALKFKDEGEWLILEPFNEIQDGGWGWSEEFKANPDPQYKVLNEWNQVFVDAVRATGGENATRWISTVGYAQSPTFTIKGLVLPKDYTTGNRIIVAFHDYDPYNYTLANPLTEQWGHTADPAKRCSDTDEQNIVDTFDQVVNTYINNNIPVYMGEMGCSYHDGDNFAFQKYYIEYFCKAAADRKIPQIVWDNGAEGSGAECHSYLNHGTGQFQNDNAETLVKLMVKAVTDTDPNYTLQTVWDSAPVIN